jgi:hypothetical protein
MTHLFSRSPLSSWLFRMASSCDFVPPNRIMSLFLSPKIGCLQKGRKGDTLFHGLFLLTCAPLYICVSTNRLPKNFYIGCPRNVILETWPPKHVTILIWINNQTNSVALSPRANYTDWSTATCRRNLVSIFVDRGVSRGQRGRSPTVVNLSFLDRSRY